MDFAQRTIDLAWQNVIEGGRPCATVIVKDGQILAEGANRVAQSHDPTAHAEVLAIREACMKLGTEHLTGTTSACWPIRVRCAWARCTTARPTRSSF
jgi:guanine deaminase